MLSWTMLKCREVLPLSCNNKFKIKKIGIETSAVQHHQFRAPWHLDITNITSRIENNHHNHQRIQFFEKANRFIRWWLFSMLDVLFVISKCQSQVKFVMLNSSGFKTEIDLQITEHDFLKRLVMHSPTFWFRLLNLCPGIFKDDNSREYFENCMKLLSGLKVLRFLKKFHDVAGCHHSSHTKTDKTPWFIMISLC